MTKGALVYEGKAKRVYQTEDPGVYWMEFKDDATAGNGAKRGTIRDKGIVNADLTRRIFGHLEQADVPTHLVGTAGERDLLVRALCMFPLEVVVRNRVAGSLAKRLGLAEGGEIGEPVVEFYYKSDPLGDPLLNDDHVRLLGIAGDGEMAELRRLARRVDDVLRPFFLDRDLVLVDFKLEFGRLGDRILLGDEITPDTCRLWDKETGERLDKDRFRRDLGGVEEAYREVRRRLGESDA